MKNSKHLKEMGHSSKDRSNLVKWVTAGKISHTHAQKLVTHVMLKKTGHTEKNKMKGHSLKNGSHLVKFVPLGKMSPT